MGSPVNRRPVRVAAVLLAALLAAPAFAAGHRSRAFAQAQTSSGAQAQLDTVMARIGSETAERDRLRSQLSDLLARIDASSGRLERAQAQAVATSDAIGRLTELMAVQQRALDRQAALAYEVPPAGALDALLSATSLTDFTDRIQYLTSAARGQRDLIMGLDASRGALGRQRLALRAARERLRATEASLRSQAASLAAQLASREQTLAGLERDRATAEALVAQLSGAGTPAGPPPAPKPSPSPSPTPTPSPMPTDPGPEAVMAMIRADFAPLGSDTVDVALCVADKESSYNPLAENPVTGAAGVYQFIPSSWTSLSGAAGWGGASVFDAEANVAVAAWTVTNFGWSNWATTAAECGA